MSEAVSASTGSELEELLLYSSRHGDVKTVQEILTVKAKGTIDFDISCKGGS